MAQVARAWGTRGQELTAAGNAGGRQTIVAEVIKRLDAGWEPDELVAELIGNQGGAQTVVGALIGRLRKHLPALPPRLAAADVDAEVEAEERLARLERAGHYGRQRAMVVLAGGLTADEADDDLVASFGTDPEALDTARAKLTEILSAERDVDAESATRAGSRPESPRCSPSAVRGLSDLAARMRPSPALAAETSDHRTMGRAADLRF